MNRTRHRWYAALIVAIVAGCTSHILTNESEQTSTGSGSGSDAGPGSDGSGSGSDAGSGSDGSGSGSDDGDRCGLADPIPADTMAQIEDWVCQLNSGVFQEREDATQSIQDALTDAIFWNGVGLEYSRCNCLPDLMTWLFETYAEECNTLEVQRRLELIGRRLSNRCNEGNVCNSLSMWPSGTARVRCRSTQTSSVVGTSVPGSPPPVIMTCEPVPNEPGRARIHCGRYTCRCTQTTGWEALSITYCAPNVHAEVDPCTADRFAEPNNSGVFNGQPFNWITRYYPSVPILNGNLQQTCASYCNDTTTICTSACRGSFEATATCCTGSAAP